MKKEGRKKTLLDLQKMKKEGEKAVFITSYDYPFALYADRAGVDMILVGDSGGMTTLGYKTTNPVTMDEMITMASAVCRAVEFSFVIGDMPYMSYQPSDRDAVVNAGKFIKVGCDAVKIEGGKGMAPRVKAMVDSGIIVMGHLGLTPQSTASFGGYRVQGKTLDSFKMILEDALALQEAGISFLLLEAMPAESAGLIAKALSVPVYGIGAGDQVDGTLVIIHDILGMFEWFVPKFIKRYADIGENITDAVGRYADEVRKRKFPQKENIYPIEKENLRKIEEWYNNTRRLKHKKER